MFIAHLPAGYLVARVCIARRPIEISHIRLLVLAGMVGGIFPDIDLIFAALSDGPRIHHHRYWPHLPAIWLGLGLLAYSLLRLARARGTRYWPATGIFLLGVASHLVLDSLVGGIWWLWPWLDQPFALVRIPATYSPWWLNFLLHWSFGVELAIVALALAWESTNPVFFLRKRVYA